MTYHSSSRTSGDLENFRGLRALSESYPLVNIRARNMNELKVPISADKHFHIDTD